MIKKYSSLLLKKGIIVEEDVEIYEYAMFVVSFNILVLSTILFIGCLCNQFTFTLLFLLFYIPNRILIGGYHCKKPSTCYFTFSFLYCNVLITKNLLQSNMIYYITVVSYVIYLLIYFKENSSFDKNKILLVMIFFIFVLLSYFFSQFRLAFVSAQILNEILLLIRVFLV